MQSAFFGIRISTYRRMIGTYHYLARCLRSIRNQTFTAWKVFLIGDCYEPDCELKELAALIPQDKIYVENLPFSPEREKYSGSDLWKVAGYTASCTGLRKVQQESIPVVVCIDDDDWWEKDHLQTLYDGYVNFPDAAFIYTQATYKNTQDVLPNETPDTYYDNLPPRAYNLIHSAASWNVTKIPLMYRNLMEFPGNYVAGDAVMWDMIRDYCTAHGLKTLYIPKKTVRHDCEHGGERIEPLLL